MGSERCDHQDCHGPATLEVVALWEKGREGGWEASHLSDVVTVIVTACEWDAASLLSVARGFGAFQHPINRRPAQPLGIYVRPLGGGCRD